MPGLIVDIFAQCKQRGEVPWFWFDTGLREDRLDRIGRKRRGQLGDDAVQQGTAAGSFTRVRRKGRQRPCLFAGRCARRIDAAASSLIALKCERPWLWLRQRRQVKRFVYEDRNEQRRSGVGEGAQQPSRCSRNGKRRRRWSAPGGISPWSAHSRRRSSHPGRGWLPHRGCASLPPAVPGPSCAGWRCGQRRPLGCAGASMARMPMPMSASNRNGERKSSASWDSFDHKKTIGNCRPFD